MPLDTFLIRVACFAPNLVLGTDWGPREEKPMREFAELAKELYDEVYEALGPVEIKKLSEAMIASAVESSERSWEEQKGMTRKQLERLAVKKAWAAVDPKTVKLAEQKVRQWARAHGGNESAVLAHYFGIVAINTLSRGGKYARDYKETPTIPLGAPKTFPDRVWDFFIDNFPPAAKTKYLTEALNRDNVLERSNNARIRNATAGMAHGNKSNRK